MQPQQPVGCLKRPLNAGDYVIHMNSVGVYMVLSFTKKGLARVTQAPCYPHHRPNILYAHQLCIIDSQEAQDWLEAKHRECMKHPGYREAVEWMTEGGQPSAPYTFPESEVG